MNYDENADLLDFSSIDVNFEKIIKHYDVLYIYYILKHMTDQEHALSINQIVTELNVFLPLSAQKAFSASTVRRAVEELVALTQSEDPCAKSLSDFLSTVFGGQIMETQAQGIVSGKNVTGKGSQSRYYFASNMTSGNLQILMGTIENNPYLSSEEKDYMRSRLRVLNPIADYQEEDFQAAHRRQIDEYPFILPAPDQKQADIPSKASTLLAHISIIHDAIEKEQQIMITTGEYTIPAKGGGHVSFEKKNNGATTMLNPYAMFWNNGKYYLVATIVGDTQPRHYRVDRIYSVKIPYAPTKNGYYDGIPREKIPESLKEFYKREKGKKQSFDVAKYTTTYPHMYIYKTESSTKQEGLSTDNKHKKVDIRFECESTKLSILIDNFGTEIRLLPSDRPHKPKTDAKGNPVKYYLVTIPHVHYDNALKFAAKNHEDLTLISPANLIEDVKASLLESLQKYKDIK